MVLQGATFNAVVAVCVVSLLLFRLPMAMLCTIAFHCSDMASLPDSPKTLKESKLLTKAFQITYYIQILIYRWIRYIKKTSSQGNFWVLNPFFSYEHQLSGVQSEQAKLNSGRRHTHYSESLLCSSLIQQCLLDGMV